MHEESIVGGRRPGGTAREMVVASGAGGWGLVDGVYVRGGRGGQHCREGRGVGGVNKKSTSRSGGESWRLGG